MLSEDILRETSVEQKVETETNRQRIQHENDGFKDRNETKKKPG